MAEPETNPSTGTALVRDTAKHGRRLTTPQIVQILAMHADGKSGPQIATAIGCHTDTVYSTIEGYSDTTSIAAKFLAGTALSAAKDWRKAVRKGAERGRHEPARDLLLHTGAIQPVQNETSGGAKVAVFIGLAVPERDTLLLQSQPVVDVQVEP